VQKRSSVHKRSATEADDGGNQVVRLRRGAPLRGVRRVAVEDVPKIINFDTGVLFLFLWREGKGRGRWAK